MSGITMDGAEIIFSVWPPQEHCGELFRVSTVRYSSVVFEQEWQRYSIDGHMTYVLAGLVQGLFWWIALGLCLWLVRRFFPSLEVPLLQGREWSRASASLPDECA
jgi:hypothetical protein